MRPQPDRLIAFMRDMIAYLGLPAYKITWNEKPERRDNLASITVSRQMYAAELRLGPSFDKLGDDEQRQTITHEVLHLAHRRLDTVIEDTMDHVPVSEQVALGDRFAVEIELITDLYANFVSDLPEVQKMWRERAHALSVA